MCCPFGGLFLGHGWVRMFSAIAVLFPSAFMLGVDIVMRVSPLYAFTLPLGATLFTFILFRSTVFTLRQGGIFWRGTFYPLKDLRRASQNRGSAP